MLRWRSRACISPSAEDAIEFAKGRVCLVEGTITPCWSYEDHDELWSPCFEGEQEGWVAACAVEAAPFSQGG
jgi:hypothetical protein